MTCVQSAVRLAHPRKLHARCGVPLPCVRPSECNRLFVHICILHCTVSITKRTRRFVGLVRLTLGYVRPACRAACTAVASRECVARLLLSLRVAQGACEFLGGTFRLLFLVLCAIVTSYGSRRGRICRRRRCGASQLPPCITLGANTGLVCT